MNPDNHNADSMEELFSRLGTPMPGKIKIKLSDTTLIIELSNECISSNMQTNNSAFESWMLCIKAIEGEKIEKVELKWEKDTSCTKDKGHYNRFMYRVMKSKHYFKWFKIHKDNFSEYESFEEDFKSKDFVINYPTTVAKTDVETDTEAYFEREFLKTELYRGQSFDARDQQLPVGVFESKKSISSHFFTFGHSAIDLWGIQNDDFWVFELKYNNKMIGIITELLFYMWFCEDTFINKKFKCDIQGKIPTVRSFDKIYNFSAKSIKGVMLYNELHPLLENNAVVEYINSQLCDSNLSIYKQKFAVPLRLV